MVVCAGCQTGSGGPSSPGSTTPDGSSDVDALLRAAAAAPEERAAQLYLEAATAQHATGDSAAADVTLGLVEPGWLPADRLPDYLELQTVVALALGDAQRAQRYAAQLDPTTLPPGTLAALEAQVCAAAGDTLCAANRQMAAFAEGSGDVDAVWATLRTVPVSVVTTEAATSSGAAGGWWALRAAVLGSHTPAELDTRVQDWRQRWAAHPAARSLPTPVALSLSPAWAPTRIGIMLPLSGPLTGAGAAVRDGIVAAYLENGEQKIRLTFYDAAAASVAELYERALGDDVDLLIGPLTKPAVTQLGQLRPEVPVLALNYLDPGVPAVPNLLQVGLAIEDEARSIAARLRESGIGSLLVFHNYDDWSTRARRTLTEQWTGRLTVQSFTDVRTVTESVGDAMEVSESRERRDALKDLLGVDLEFLPRARGDVDAVVALIDNVEANALAPALRFHFAEHLPVFACSQVVRAARPQQLLELERFEVSELPWFLGADPLHDTMDSTFALQGNRYASLYALGIDAFRISMRFGAYRSSGELDMLGSTGGLSLQADGRFRRELFWAVIRDGRVQPAKPRAMDAVGD